MAGLNNFDYIIVALVLLGAFYGLGRGVLRMITSLLSLVLGLAAALTWYGIVSSFLQRHFNTSPVTSTVIGYIVVFLAVAAAIEFIGRRIMVLVYIVHLSWIDRVGGALLGAGLGLVFAGIAIVLVESVIPADSAMVRDSKLAPRVLAFDQSLLGYVPTPVRELYQRKSDELKQSWERNNQSPAGQPRGGTSGT
jgi:uncharacterized membrane protein required for colicin V production